LIDGMKMVEVLKKFMQSKVHEVDISLSDGQNLRLVNVSNYWFLDDAFVYESRMDREINWLYMVPYNHIVFVRATESKPIRKK